MTGSSSSFYLNWIVDRHSDLDSSFLKSLKHLHLKVPPGTCQALALSKAKDSRPQKMRTRLTGLTFKCQNKFGSTANNGSLVQLQHDDSFPNPDKALIFTMTELLGKVLWAVVLFPSFHNPNQFQSANLVHTYLYLVLSGNPFATKTSISPASQIGEPSCGGRYSQAPRLKQRSGRSTDHGVTA